MNEHNISEKNITEKTHVVFLLFGANGDLVKKKLAKAIIDSSQSLHYNATIIGTGRKKFSAQEYNNFIANQFDPHSHITVDYCQIDVTTSTGDELKSHIPQADLYVCYFATSYTLFDHVARVTKHALKHIHAHHIRIMVEKPFGHNEQSAKMLYQNLCAHFHDSQLYFVDHYVAKPAIDNLLYMRFANSLFNHIWNSHSIERIFIQSDEFAGVESRIEYYNGVGVLRDMFQNHLLQVAAFTCMSQPENLHVEQIKNAKIHFLQSLTAKRIQIGQYDTYETEASSFEKKYTPTFAQIEFHSSLPEWKSIPLVLQSGKRLVKKNALIQIDIRQIQNELFHRPSNKILIHIQPHQNVELLFNHKFAHSDIEPVYLSFCQEDSRDGYSTIISDCVQANKRLFISQQEIELCWRIIDHIHKKVENIPLQKYKSHTHPQLDWIDL